MNPLRRLAGFVRAFYLTPRCYAALVAAALLFALGYALPLLAVAARGVLVVTLALTVLDAFLLFGPRAPLHARRQVADRLSNGDANPVRVDLENGYAFEVQLTVLDELPLQFQERGGEEKLRLAGGARRVLERVLRPTERGAYHFGTLNVYARSPLGLVERRFRFEQDGREVKVYPAFQQLRRYRLLAASQRLQEVGDKRQRRPGQAMAFDHVRPYTLGDDPRHVNWRATARRVGTSAGHLMVNAHREERGQPVYCLIDTGRAMKMPFDGLTLLDHSINAALVLAGVALEKGDRTGLVVFADRVRRVVPAARRGRQMQLVLDALYRVGTDFRESTLEHVVATLDRQARHRGLLLVFTNFETESAARRALPYLRLLARRHVVVVIFFENVALRGLLTATSHSAEEVYVKTVARRFAHEKQGVVRLLQRHGIRTVLTPPRDLTVDTLNAYLTLKAQGIV